ncbi:MAG: type V CRISPR-associated protein Cas12a/Cpf1 [Treponema sp.]|nr:type V CRISPR-associated protein Cas12a/Cpf1 [Treponema sp.]
MNKTINDFTDLYSLSKTLRFELKPVGQTLENIKNGHFLELDKKKADDYQDVKKIIDNYHKFFIDDVLKNASLDWNRLEDATSEYNKNKNDDSKLLAEQKRLREEILKLFTSDKRFKALTAPTPKYLFNSILPDWFGETATPDLNKAALETFQKFTSYFKGFQENIKNVYSADAIPTAVPYRIVNDNFPKFLQNISIFKTIQEKCPQVIDDVENELCRYLGQEKLSDIFTLESFNKYLGQGGKEVQRGIDFYNQIIGGIAEKEGGVNLRGINQFLNLYWQQHPDFAKENRRLKMVPLYKQILSDRSSLSFKIASIANDEELKNALLECADKLESKNEEGKTVFDETCDLFASLKNQNLSGIYVNRKDINVVSRILTGDWSWLQSRMNAYAEEKFTTKAEKAHWQKSLDDEGENKSKGFYSLAELNELLEYASENVAETNIRISDYFEHRCRFYVDKESERFIQGSELVALSIKEMCDDIQTKRKGMNRVLENLSDEKQLREKSDDVAVIKDYLDAVQDLLHRIKPIKVNGAGDSSFYSIYDSIYSALSEVISVYNKTRNYITKKAASPEKYKLNFDNPTLADGWDLNKEQANTSVLLRKDGMYYLGIMNPKNKPKFAEKYEVTDGQSCYEKMIYKQFDATKQIPKCSTQKKEVQKYFLSGATEPYILNDKKSFKSELIITKDIWFMNNHVWDGEKFVPKRDNETRPKKFQIGYFKQTGDFDGYKNALSKWISFCKEFLQSYISSTVYDYNFKKSDEYEGLDDFYNYLNATCYKLTFINIPSSEIEKMVSEGKLYLFQIYNKDFAPGASGIPNMHTLYWKNLFSDENLKNVCLKLNGEAELFYRRAEIKDPVVHKEGSYLVNRTTEDGESIPEKIYLEIYKNANGKLNNLSKEASEYKESHKVVIKQASHEIIKDRHYTEPKFLFHVPLTINFKASGNSYSINENVRRFLKNNPDVNIIGLDRGERHLIYLSLINQKGEIIKQFTFNDVERQKNGKTIKVNYHEKLDQREKERDAARKSWQAIGKIAELKEGYLSAVIHQLTKLMVEYNAIVVMEDLNFGFKRGRFHVEKQVYQKFEHMLIDKLNYLVFKDRGLNEPGGVLNGYQLAGQFESFQKLGKQSGILFYVSAAYTSKIDPKTGFVSMMNFKDLTNVHKKRDFFSKFEDIHFDEATGSFVFTFDYKNFDGKAKEEMKQTKWAVYSREKRIVYFAKTKSYEDIMPTEKLEALFESAGIEYKSGNNIHDSVMAVGADLKEGAKPSKEIADFWDGLLYNFKLILQMRNSNAKTGEDYIISPVIAGDGTFFDSREETKKGKEAKLPVDADANGAYHIALKGLSLINKINLADEDELKKFDMKISNADWFKFAQEKKYAE